MHCIGPAVGPGRLSATCLAPHELVEPAQFTVLGAVLMKERDAGLVEFLEELVPTDPVEPFVFAIKVETQDAGMTVVHCCLDGRRLTPRSSAHLRMISWLVVACASVSLVLVRLALIGSSLAGKVEQRRPPLSGYLP